MKSKTCSILLAALCAARAAFGQASVRTSDGLALQWDPRGRVALALDGRPLPAAGLAGGFYAAEITGEGEEMLKNGSLEIDANADGVPDGFQSGGVWRRDDTVARSGRWSMKADIAGERDGLSGSFGVVAPVEGGATYLASFWLKCRNRRGRYPASSGYLQQRDEKGERTTKAFQQMMHGAVTGTQDWTRVWLLLTTNGDTRRLYFRTDIYHGRGTLWVDDFSLKKIGGAAARIPTRAEATRAGVRVWGEDAARRLRVDATWTPAGEALRLAGRITSLDARERCVRLSLRLPLDAAGGAWWSDIGTRKTIQPGGRYARTAACGRFGPYSVYPFTAVDTPDGRAGVSLGVPMHPPRPFRLAYAADEGLAAEWDFGLSPLPKRFPNSADFYAVLYRHDPRWGFRSAAEKYYRLFPDDFAARVKRFGLWYCMDLNKLRRPEEFGFAYNERTTRAAIAKDHQLGYLNFGYTEPWGWWGWALGLRPKKDAPKPSYEEMVRILKQRAGRKDLLAKPGLNPANVALTILHSGVYDERGRFSLCPHYVARWGGYNWRLNPSPYAAPGQLSRFTATYAWEIEPKLKMGADGVYLDSIVGGWAAAPNYRREHIERARSPLTFSRLTRKPAQLGVWNHYEFVEYVSRDLHGRGKLLMANIFPWYWVFFAHRLDVLGHETWAAEGLDKMRAERTLAYHKPYAWLMQQGEGGPAENREKWMQQALLYGIAANVVGGTNDPARYEKWRGLYKKYMPVVIALCEAGWEPVTHAAVQPPGLLVERFGPRGDKLYFTVRNESAKAAAFSVAVDLAALRFPSPRRVLRLPERKSVTWRGARFQDSLAPGCTRAYELVP